MLEERKAAIEKLLNMLSGKVVERHKPSVTIAIMAKGNKQNNIDEKDPEMEDEENDNEDENNSSEDNVLTKENVDEAHEEYGDKEMDDISEGRIDPKDASDDLVERLKKLRKGM